jgi:hypothetical protein
VLYDSFMHVCASQPSGAATVADLKGKRVSVGSAGSSTESIADGCWRAPASTREGRDPRQPGRRRVRRRHEGRQDRRLLLDRRHPDRGRARPRHHRQPPIRFISTQKELAAMEAKYPGLYRPFLLPKAAYAGMTEDVPGLGVANVLVVPAKRRRR